MADGEGRKEILHTTYPVFKGATRPAMVLGVPVGPFIAAAIPTFLLAFWVHIAIGALFVLEMLVMRQIAKKDDYRFHQIGLALRSFGQCRANKKFWGGFLSLSPSMCGRAEKHALYILREPRKAHDSPLLKRQNEQIRREQERKERIARGEIFD